MHVVAQRVLSGLRQLMVRSSRKEIWKRMEGPAVKGLRPRAASTVIITLSYQASTSILWGGGGAPFIIVMMH